ncbi:UPF0158 family protein [Aequorivita marina]|uniref:UPF0158 family protein n=1 Tax=Aequorivita marina TaxID=3073654 RepID=UPI002876F7B4|nr:UPF0158 family protein [Aequorivita sp. S2608]MDS1299652.1 UPF0158 family protein [Aequorivita sp. S2608]
MKTEKNVIQEIADSLLCGMVCYYEKATNTFIEIPEEAEDFLMMEEENPWQEVIEKVEENEDDYILIDPMHSTQAFKVMEEFARQVDSLSVSSKLLDALDRHNPFRNFKHLIENDSDYREEWFNFRLQKNMAWVKKQIELG